MFWCSIRVPRDEKIRPSQMERADLQMKLGTFCGQFSGGFHRGVAVLVVQGLIGLGPRHGVLRRHNHAVGQMQGAGIGNVGVFAKGDGANALSSGAVRRS